MTEEKQPEPVKNGPKTAFVFDLRNILYGCAGMFVGALVGYQLFFWVAGQGFYAIVVPGALTGLGCAIGMRKPCLELPILSALIGEMLGFFTEWRFAPFAADPGLFYFIAHIHQLKPISLALIGIGSVLAFFIPFRR